MHKYARSFFRVIVAALVVTLLVSSWSLLQRPLYAQSFTSTTLSNANISSPTSIQWGPDGRLYVAQQDGTIQALTIAETSPGVFSATAQESINIIKQIPNHDDDGSLAPAEWQGTRQVTGIVITSSPTDATVPVIYVGSSDPRIGAGSNQTDVGLDTNSGIITKLTLDPVTGTWSALDLVRGLPRSEENHSTNGLQLSADELTLYVAQGGHTNAGAPSANFALLTEYALSAAVLSVDLAAIESLPTQTDANGRDFKYNLPTLNDPLRADVSSTSGFTDPNDPFGGNDGLNQAKIDPNGPVQIYSPGWRNAYDLVITEFGNMWVIDNGPNPGWGGHPLGESDYPTDADGDPPGICTNDYDPTEPGSNDVGPGGDPAVNNEDNLHLVTQGYYGGHPAPVRGNLDAGIYVNDTWYQPGDPNLPSDWADLTPSANAVECDYRQPGVDDGALVTWYKKSVNGIAEYVAQGDLYGDLLLASLNDGTIYRVDLAADGASVLGSSALASGFTAPLDLTITGDDSPYPGLVWIATYGNGGSVGILIPDSDLICDGVYDNTIDDDGDGYTNADEIDNNKNPCSAADIPDNNDVDSEQAEIDAGLRTFLLSDLNDPDDDDDGTSDIDDPFQVDETNGTELTLPVFKDLFLGSVDKKLAGGVGFTGLAVDGTRDYLNMFDPSNLLTGGATGQFSIIETSDGLPDGNLNSLDNGFQFGFQPSGVPFEATAVMIPNYFNGTPADGHEQGFYLGTGDQNNYVRVTLANEAEYSTLGGTDGGIKVVYESAGSVVVDRYPVAGLVGTSESVEVSILVDPIAGTLQPQYKVGTGSMQTVGTPIPVSGEFLDAVQSTRTLPGGSSVGLAAGVFASSGGSGVSYQADYESISIEEVSLTSSATLAVTQGGTIDASTYTNGAFSLANESTGGETITKLRIDLRGALLPDIVFDPDGTAGDIDAKPFTPNSGASTVGYVSAQMLEPKNGVDGDDGYSVLEVTFNDFQPGETFTFSIDADPNSIKGAPGPGPNSSGSVSGLEMTGSLVSLDFSDGYTQTSELFRGIPSTTVSGGYSYVETGRPPVPNISVLEAANPGTVEDPNATVRIAGPAGANVRLVQVEGGFYEPDGGAYNYSPYDINSVVSVNEKTVSIGSSGVTDVPVTLVKTEPDAGYNVFTAAVVSSNGIVGDVSSPVLVEYAPTKNTVASDRINAGGSSYTDSDGNAWNADNYATEGKTYSDAVSVSGTNDPTLYQSERYGDFTYSIPVSDGTYSLRLHFAELYWGVKKGNGVPGERVFDVIIEGQLVLDNYDILAKVGPSTALVETVSGISVSDQTLDIQFVTEVNNAKVSAIEVLESSSAGYTLTTSTSGSGTVTKNPDQATYTSGTSVELTATPSAGWVFQEWTGDVTSTANPVTTQIFGDMSITAVFAEDVATTEYAVNTTVSGSGTVTKSPDQQTYSAGSTVELTATPASGWYFSGWSGDASGTTNPLTVTVNSELNIEAAFTQLPSAEAFQATLTIRDAADRSVSRVFGANGSATSGFDAGLDVEAPPSPPSGAFDARFASGSVPLFTDIRPSVAYPSTTTWDVQVQGSDTPLVMTWDPSFLPAGAMTLATGTTTVNMKTESSAVISTTPATLTITYAPYDPVLQESATYSANAGWTLWGLPYDVGGTPYETVLPLATPGSLIGFDGTYESLSALTLGRGHWVNFASAGNQTFDGFPLSSTTLGLESGWNLVAGPNCSAALPSSITTAYAYLNGSYTSVTASEPYQGIWVLSDTQQRVTLTCSSSATLVASSKAQNGHSAIDRVATITVRDANGATQSLFVARPVEEEVKAVFSMPPLPPGDAFDVRFEGDTRLAVETTSRIRLQSSAYPLTITVEGDLDGTRVKSEADGQRISERQVSSGDTFQITDPSVNVLSFEMNEWALDELPAQFALKYNYPNPFRTSTAVVFDLPEPSDVRLDVYNILGQRVVSQEFSQMSPQSDQEITLDARGLSSGVYFYRVTVRANDRTQTDTGKMVVVR